jgi:hypothetical protein
MCNYSCCSHNKFGKRTLRKYITDFAYNQRIYFNLKRIGQACTLVYRIKASIKNGEGIIGYNYLHGADMKAGGLYLRIVARKLIRSVVVTVYCTWNDWINANHKYDSDKYKADLAKKIPFTNPTDYIIRISWTERFLIGGM